MARPSKSTDVLKSEKKSHRTKAELKLREEAERAALTGFPLRECAEVKRDPIAHKEFMRVRKLLSAVGKNDALFESVINDYCVYKADILRYTEYRKNIQSDLDALCVDEMDPETRYNLKIKMRREIMDCDKQIQTFQKKRFAIEKENGMTIASSMRSIPKQAEKKENLLLEVLRDVPD